MKSIGITLIALMLFSCHSKNKDVFSLEEATVKPGYLMVESNAIDEDIQEVLNYSGIRVLGKYKLKLNTDNPNYFFFLAIIDQHSSEEGTSTSSDLKLRSVDFFESCFLWDLSNNRDSSFYETEMLYKDFMVDYRMNELLGNDSLYYSTNGFQYQASPEPMTLASYPVTSFEVKSYNLDKPVPLFTAGIRIPKNKGSNVSSYMMYGMISYDCQKNYDFKSLFDSRSFKSLVWTPDLIDKMDKLMIDNYIIEE